MSTETPTMEEMLRASTPPKWVMDMHEHYAKTGAFRTVDVLRVLGDPKHGVRMPSGEQAKSFFGVSQD